MPKSQTLEENSQKLPNHSVFLQFEIFSDPSLRRQKIVWPSAKKVFIGTVFSINQHETKPSSNLLVLNIIGNEI